MDAASIRFAACNICDEASGFNGNWKIEAGLAVLERLSQCQFRDPNGWGQPFYNLGKTVGDNRSTIFNSIVPASLEAKGL